MQRTVSISCLSLFALLAVAQEGVRRTPGGVPLPPSTAGSQEAARGIEKKDLRALIVYPENVYSPADVQRIEASVRTLVDEIASGAKLTKADAARAAQSEGSIGALAAQAERRLAAGNGVAVLSVAAWPSSAGNKQVPCPPENCGCTDQGGVSCNCSYFEKHCYCWICLPRTTLTTFEEEPVWSGGIHIKGGRLANPGQGGPRGFLIALVAPPDAPVKQRQALLASAVETIQKEPWPERLVIKTKSTPPYHEGDPLPRMK